jgi:hypothetical protein
MEEGDFRSASHPNLVAPPSLWRPIPVAAQDREGTGGTIQSAKDPPKNQADWGKYIDPAGNIVRHLRNGKEADQPLVCGV